MGENSEQSSGLMVMVTLPYGKFEGKKLLSLGRAKIHNSDRFDLNRILLFLKSLYNDCFIVPSCRGYLFKYRFSQWNSGIEQLPWLKSFQEVCWLWKALEKQCVLCTKP